NCWPTHWSWPGSRAATAGPRRAAIASSTASSSAAPLLRAAVLLRHLAARRRVARAAARRAAAGVLLRVAGVGTAAVVRLVEARALEDHAGAGADQPFERAALARGALAQRLRRHRLELLEAVPAGGAQIVVGGHAISLPSVRRWRPVRPRR